MWDQVSDWTGSFPYEFSRAIMVIWTLHTYLKSHENTLAALNFFLIIVTCRLVYSVDIWVIVISVHSNCQFSINSNFASGCWVFVHTSLDCGIHVYAVFFPVFKLFGVVVRLLECTCGNFVCAKYCSPLAVW